MLEAIKTNLLLFLSDLQEVTNFKNDEAYMRQAIEHDYLAVEHASEGLRNNEEFMKFAITQSSGALKFASKTLQKTLHKFAEASPNIQLNRVLES